MASTISAGTSVGNSIAISGDTSGQLQLQTNNGTTAVTIDASQNVGIGTSSPSQRLTVSTSAGDTASFISSNSNMDIYLAASGTTLGNTRLRATGGDMAFITGLNERMRIDSSGNLLVGTTTQPGAGASTVGNEFISAGGFISCRNSVAGYTGYVTNTSGSGLIQFYSNTTAVGSISTNGTTTTYGTSSDYRLKTVICNISDAGQRIDALEPVEYDWKTGGRTRGFLAHKFAEVYPSSVSGEKDAVDKDGKPVYQAMQASTSEVMADLVAEIQSLRKRIATLEAK